MAIKKAIGRTSLKILETTGGINIINRRGKSLLKITESGVVGADLEQNDSNTNVISVNPSTGVFELTSVASLTAGEWSVSGSDLYYSAGKVSVGTATPDADGVFTVKGTTSDGTTKCVSFTDSADVEIANINTDGDSYFAGTVGIGIAPSIAKLTVNRSGASPVVLFQNTDNYAELQFKGGQAGDVAYSFLSGFPNVGDFTIREAGVADRLTIKKTSGQIGLGTSTMTASTVVTAKGTTADGSTKIVSFTDSADVEVASINTDGLMQLSSHLYLPNAGQVRFDDGVGSYIAEAGNGLEFFTGSVGSVKAMELKSSTAKFGNNSIALSIDSGPGGTVINGTTNDGSTLITNYTDSDDLSVASIDTNGVFTMVGSTNVSIANSSGQFILSRGAEERFRSSTADNIFNFGQLDTQSLIVYGSDTVALLKVDASTDTVLVGADSAVDTGSILEVNGGLLAGTVVEANTAVSASPNVITSGESGKVFTNEGATAENHHDLPAAVAGLGPYTFIVQDVDGMQINAATGDTIRIAASVSAGGGLIETTTIGNTVTLVCINATEWVATAVNGTWTVT